MGLGEKGSKNTENIALNLDGNVHKRADAFPVKCTQEGGRLFMPSGVCLYVFDNSRLDTDHHVPDNPLSPGKGHLRKSLGTQSACSYNNLPIFLLVPN